MLLGAITLSGYLNVAKWRDNGRYFLCANTAIPIHLDIIIIRLIHLHLVYIGCLLHWWDHLATWQCTLSSSILVSAHASSRTLSPADKLPQRHSAPFVISHFSPPSFSPLPIALSSFPLNPAPSSPLGPLQLFKVAAPAPQLLLSLMHTTSLKLHPKQHAEFIRVCNNRSKRTERLHVTLHYTFSRPI